MLLNFNTTNIGKKGKLRASTQRLFILDKPY